MFSLNYNDRGGCQIFVSQILLLQVSSNGVCGLIYFSGAARPLSISMSHHFKHKIINLLKTT